MNPLRKILLTSVTAAAMFAPLQAMAEEFATDENAALEASKDEIAGFSSAIKNDELDHYRGRFGSSPTTLMFNNMTATLSENSASNTVSGANSIGENAFSNVAGLTNVIQNSGNNVIIQSSFQVNVNFHDSLPE